MQFYGNMIIKRVFSYYAKNKKYFQKLSEIHNQVLILH